MNWQNRPEDRYMTDLAFHSLVDLLTSLLEQNAMKDWTPSDLREAVMLASCMYEARHVKPLLIDKNKVSSEFIRELDERR